MLSVLWSAANAFLRLPPKPGAAATTLILNTAQKRAADFELKGNGSFTSDGFFTLA
ncbi:MAG: hypothetical protein IKI76_03100 [Selenomonadaceae bacterium]|nr:hypothetical protein [Selenomonadaceae bacterium]